MTRLGVILAFLISSSAFAFNDQCENLTQKQAKAAESFIADAFQATQNIPVIDYLCEHCENNEYIRPIVMDSVKLKTAGKVFQILINGKIQNTAYLYLNGRNIAHYIGCKPKAVSAFIND
jgi:hypothetical protein